MTFKSYILVYESNHCNALAWSASICWYLFHILVHCPQLYIIVLAGEITPTFSSTEEAWCNRFGDLPTSFHNPTQDTRMPDISKLNDLIEPVGTVDEDE